METARRGLKCGIGRAAWCAAAWLLLCSGTNGRQTSAENSPLAGLFNELVVLVRSGQWGAMEWARGGYLSLQITRYGPAGAPYMRGRFTRAGVPEEAFLAGVYVATYGGDVDHRLMRRTLETDGRKRAWLQAMAGDWKALRGSMRSGAQWQPALRFLPALTGCRSFCRLCAASDDALVRRAGLMWGFWMADAAYWQTVRNLSVSDRDPLSRQFAQYLCSRSPTAVQ